MCASKPHLVTQTWTISSILLWLSVSSGFIHTPDVDGVNKRPWGLVASQEREREGYHYDATLRMEDLTTLKVACSSREDEAEEQCRLGTLGKKTHECNLNWFIFCGSLLFCRLVACGMRQGRSFYRIPIKKWEYLPLIVQSPSWKSPGQLIRYLLFNDRN